MVKEQYIKRMEELMNWQRNDQANYQRSMETVMAQVGKMALSIEQRDQ